MAARLVDQIHFVLDNYKDDPNVTSVISQLLIKYNDAVTAKQVEQQTADYKKNLIDIYSRKESKVRNTMRAVTKDVQNYLKVHQKDLLADSSKDLSVRDRIETAIRSYIRTNSITVDGMTDVELVNFLTDRINGLDILQSFMDDDNVDEIRVNEYNDIRIVVNGVEERTDLAYEDPEDLKYLLTAIEVQTAMVGETSALSTEKPFLRSRLGLNSRVSVMRDPVAIRPTSMNLPLDAPVAHIVIRKQKLDKITLEKLVAWGSIDQYGADTIKRFMRTKQSIIFYGGTGTGKSAILGAALLEYPPELRAISMAEIDEINPRVIDTREYLVDGSIRLEDKNPNYRRAVNSIIQWEFQDLNKKYVNNLPAMQGGLNAALTMTPDCIIMQEIKGGEIEAMFSAGLSDHQLLTTMHCKNEDALNLRTIIMFKESGVNLDDHIISQQIPLVFPIAVKLSRYRNGKKVVEAITEFTGYDMTTRKLKKRLLYKFLVEKTYYAPDPKTGENKLHIEGTHYAVNFPSAERIQSMHNEGGLTDAELQEYKLQYSNNPHRLSDEDIIERFKQQAAIL